MNSREILYLARKDIEEIGLPMTEIINLIENVFVEKAAGRADLPPKAGIQFQSSAFMNAMPAHLSKLRAAGLKWVSASAEP